MITLEQERLGFRFPDVHENASCDIEFQRTLRIPDDDSDYPLPPGLGPFPLRHLDDYAARLRRGGGAGPNAGNRHRNRHIGPIPGFRRDVVPRQAARVRCACPSFR